MKIPLRPGSPSSRAARFICRLVLLSGLLPLSLNAQRAALGVISGQVLNETIRIGLAGAAVSLEAHPERAQAR